MREVLVKGKCLFWKGPGVLLCIVYSESMSTIIYYINSLTKTRSSLLGLPQVSLINAKELRE